MNRAERRYRTSLIVDRRKRQIKYAQPFNKDYVVGSFKKKSPMDCGSSKCFSCHPEKISGTSSRQKLLFDLSYR